MDPQRLFVQCFPHAEGHHLAVHIQGTAAQAVQELPVGEHAVDGLVLGTQGRGVLAFVPLAPVVLQAQHVFHHGVVQRPVVDAVSLFEAAQVVALLVIAVAGQGGQVALQIQVFPLAARIVLLDFVRQGRTPAFQQFFGHADEAVAGFDAAGCPVHGIPVAHGGPVGDEGHGLAQPAQIAVKGPLQAEILLPAPDIGQAVVQGTPRGLVPQFIEFGTAVQGDGGEGKIFHQANLSLSVDMMVPGPHGKAGPVAVQQNIKHDGCL